jgi:hypothetical protein
MSTSIYIYEGASVSKLFFLLCTLQFFVCGIAHTMDAESTSKFVLFKKGISPVFKHNTFKVIILDVDTRLLVRYETLRSTTDGMCMAWALERKSSNIRIYKIKFSYAQAVVNNYRDTVEIQDRYQLMEMDYIALNIEKAHQKITEYFTEESAKLVLQ